MEKLDSYFQPQKNVIYERYVFKQTRPSPDESVDHFITRLRQVADTCEFASVEDEIRDHFVITWPSKVFRAKLLREPTLTLEKLQELARAQETANRHASVMADEEDTKLNRLTTNRSRSGDQNESFQQESKTANISGKYTGNCFNCGSNYFPGHKQVCPAQGKSCRSCGKLNHFAKVCRSSSMRKPEFRVQTREKSNEIDNSIKAIITTPNLVPRACDPREGNEGSGIIRFRDA